MLGAAMTRPGLVDIVSTILAVEHFYPEHHQWIWQAILDASANGATPDQSAVAARLNTRQQLSRAGGVDYLEDCCCRPAIAEPALMATSLRDMFRVRSLEAAAAAMSAAARGPIENIQTFLEEAAQSVAEIAAKPADSHTVTIQDATRAVFEQITANADKVGGLTGLATGCKELDELLGGWQRREQTILAARPGMGKTAAGVGFALTVADTITNNVRKSGVLFFSQEMERNALATRVICGEARINSNHLRTGQLGRYKDPWADLTRAARWINELPLVIHDEPAMSPQNLRAVARRQIGEWKADSDIELAMIVIDYLQLMKMRKFMAKTASREEEVAECARLTRELARELNVPVLVLAALKRGIDKQVDKKPVLADLRESGAIEAHADTVIFIHREEFYLREKCPPEKKREAEYIVEKQRNGPNGIARTNFYGPYTLFTDEDLGWKQGDEQ